jgi:hypothetical protein
MDMERGVIAMYNPPAYVWAVILAGTIGVPTLTTIALYRGAAAAGIGRRSALLLGAVAAALLGGWLVVSGVIAGHGWYNTPLGQQPPWLLIAVVGVTLALLAATRIPSAASAIAAPGTLVRLHEPHTIRVAGIVFLLMMALGHLPALFALPAGLGDMATGIAAPFVARRLANGTGHRAAVWFNALGIADLVVALTIGGLTSLQLIAVTPSAQAIAELPLTLIPTTTVPLLLTLHITSLRRLAAVDRKQSERVSRGGQVAVER